MAPRWMQETGISDGMAQSGPPNGTAVKAAGAGVLGLIAALRDGLGSTMLAGVHVLWLSWMVLGLARAHSQGEQFCAKKAIGGGWKLVAVWAIWASGTVVETMLADQGQSVPVTAAALGWVSVAFLIRVADAGSYFFPGLREVLTKVAPSMFPADATRNRRASDKEPPT